MRVSRGCGCPVVILALANLLFVAGSIFSLIRGPAAEPVSSTRFGAGLVLAVFLGNLIVCAVLAVAALGGRTIGSAHNESSPDDPGSDDANVDTGDEDDLQ